jgi:hypothetical protein
MGEAFFVPYAEDAKTAENVWDATCKFVSAPLSSRRVRSLQWSHNNKTYRVEVGKPAPSYFQTGIEPVVVIADSGHVLYICTWNRGVMRGDPILCSEQSVLEIEYFDPTLPTRPDTHSETEAPH